MLSDATYEVWFHESGLPDNARPIIDQVRSTPPFRNARPSAGRSIVIFPSRKMGCTIQGENKTVQYTFIRECEYDNDVYEYYDQPSASVWLEYEKNGRHVRPVQQIADYFVIGKTWTGWVRCATEEELLGLEKENPNLCCRDAEGRWHCPPGERYAAKFGLGFRVYSSAEVNWVWQHNMDFLDDYRRGQPVQVPEEIVQAVRELVEACPGITIDELLACAREVLSDVTADHIYRLIADGRVYANLHAVRVSERAHAALYTDREAAQAWDVATASRLESPYYRPRTIQMVAGEEISWDGRIYEILVIGDTEVFLQHKGTRSYSVHLPHVEFERYVRGGVITSPLTSEESNMATQVREIFARASMEDRAKANRLREDIDPWLGDDPPTPIRDMPRTLRRALDRYRWAQRVYNCGYVGLLPKQRPGDTRHKMPAATSELLDWYIKNQYEVAKQPSRYAVWCDFKADCEKRAIAKPDDYLSKAPSYVTFCDRVKKRPRPEQVRKRQGGRAARQHESQYWELTMTTPRHGDRPMAIAHLDHTQLDVEVYDSGTGRDLGRPWVTILEDAFSRRKLSEYLTFQAPSALSCMMALRICVYRYGRLPQVLVVDGAREFRSVAFDTLMARYEITKRVRPWHDPHYGSVCERLIGTTMKSFIHLLTGNTQITKLVRQMTRSHDPRRLTAWTIGDLNLHLLAWSDEYYDTRTHLALGMSPREAWERGMERSGAREHMMIGDLEEFRHLTMDAPPGRKGTREVQGTHGVKIQNIYYGCDEFKDPSVIGTQVQVVRDPFDAAKAEAYVHGRWVPLVPEWRASFLGHSIFEIAMATEELHARDRLAGKANRTITAARLAEHMASVHEDEKLLLQQRRDMEQKNVREQLELIYGGRASVGEPNLQLPDSMPELDAAGGTAADAVPSLPPATGDDRRSKTFGRLL